jgi:hypothetical protein
MRVNFRIGTHIDGHLVDVDAFLDTKLGNKDIESSIQNIDDSGLTDNRTISMSEVGDQDA